MSHHNTSTLEPSSERTMVLAWLEAIEETDQNVISEVLNRCASNPIARAYFIGLANELSIEPQPITRNLERGET